MKKTVEQLLKLTGVEINGPHPWDIQILDDRFYQRVLTDPSLGLGESYMDGWWECAQMDEMFARVLKSNIDQHLKKSPRELFTLMLHRIFNYQTKFLSKEVAEKHYDLGNSFYQKMLGPSMNYSCGYWIYAADLETAEQNKMELICRKLMLKPGLKLLDIGCGWGSLARYAAANYGVEVVGITISSEQKKYAEEVCQGLPVTILNQDYRDLPPQNFDRIVSVGMFEHVGYKNYPEFMQIVHRQLRDEGIFLLHTIGANVSSQYGDPWLNKYIFPHGMLPSPAQVSEAMEPYFVMEDWHNFGADYDRTLMAWHHRFNEAWPDIKDEFDERFRRMWNYYLLSCAGAFRARKLQLWQVIMTKNGLPGGFHQRGL
ncbi:MAG TPA: cyclopropane fatty acyl phospholipid synthase [Parachlamydiaceae bacterium]|nr:cyclopropane fatty acyl phospholipid synthase [Parachlamydiaceae bacterium]